MEQFKRRKIPSLLDEDIDNYHIQPLRKWLLDSWGGGGGLKEKKILFIIVFNDEISFKCYCLRKPGDMAKSRNMKVVQIYSFLVW